MAQAECITTAIRELPSRERPPKSTSPRPAHIVVYLTAIVADATQNIAGSTLDRRHLGKLLQEFLATVLGVIHTAAAEMRTHENWRVL